MTGKRLVQGCCAVSWVGFEPKTLELQGRTRSPEPRFDVISPLMTYIMSAVIFMFNDAAFRLAPPIDGLMV